MVKKILAALAFAPAAVFADGAAAAYAQIALPGDVDAAISAASTLGESLAQKVAPAVLGIGAAFLIVAVAFFVYRVVVKFLAGSKRG